MLARRIRRAGRVPITRYMPPNQVYQAVHGVLHGMHPGTGEAEYRIRDEWASNPRNHHEDGSIVMAHKSDPDSGKSLLVLFLFVQAARVR